MPSNESPDAYAFVGNSDKAGFGPFSAILPMPVDVPTGWECPRCRRIYSPRVAQCVSCSVPDEPRWLRWPVGGPGCPGCAAGRESGETAEHTIADDGITIRLPAFLAEGSKDGFPRCQITRLGDDWRDVFPGQLQARLSSPVFVPAGTEFCVEFRLPPKDDADD